jgi:hypothetical protein
VLVTETKIHCSECGDTGYVPPFMDPCTACNAYANATVHHAILEGTVVTKAPTDSAGSVQWAVYRDGRWVDAPAPKDADAILAAAKARETPTFTGKAGATTGLSEAIIDVAAASVTPPAPLPKGTKPITPSQLALLTKLIAERDQFDPTVVSATAALAKPLSAKVASAWIDKVMKLPADPAKKAPQPNLYGGTCVKCGGYVDAKAGHRAQVDGVWQTSHVPGACLTAVEKALFETTKVTEPGLYRFVTAAGETQVYRVKYNQPKTRLYGELVIPPKMGADGKPITSVEFQYNAKAIKFLSSADKLTWTEARDFGAAYSACVACGRNLEDPRSVVQCYGPKCADNYGWPTVTAKQAKAILDGTLTFDDVLAMKGLASIAQPGALVS